MSISFPILPAPVVPASSELVAVTWCVFGSLQHHANLELVTLDDLVFSRQQLRHIPRTCFSKFSAGSRQAQRVQDRRKEWHSQER